MANHLHDLFNHITHLLKIFCPHGLVGIVMSARQIQLFVLSILAAGAAGVRTLVSTQQPAQAQPVSMTPRHWFPPAKVNDFKALQPTVEQACLYHLRDRSDLVYAGSQLLPLSNGIQLYAVCHYRGVPFGNPVPHRIQSVCPPGTYLIRACSGRCVSGEEPKFGKPNGRRDDFIFSPRMGPAIINGFEPGLDTLILIGFKSRPTVVRDSSGATVNVSARGSSMLLRFKNGVTPQDILNSLSQYGCN